MRSPGALADRSIDWNPKRGSLALPATTRWPFVVSTLRPGRTHLVAEIVTVWHAGEYHRTAGLTTCDRYLHSVTPHLEAPEGLDLCDECALADYLRPTVYRLRDDRDWLLYVGCTINFPARLRSHVTGSDFWPLVASWSFEEFDSLDAALAEEARAIKADRPLFNRDLTVRAKRRGRRPAFRATTASQPCPAPPPPPPPKDPPQPKVPPPPGPK